MEAQNLAEHGQVGDIAVSDLPADARLLAEVPLQALIHQPFVAGGMAVIGLHLLSCSTVVAMAAGDDDPLKTTVLQQVAKAGDDRPLAFD